MTFSMHRSLVTTTALSAMGIICGASPALATPANLEVSAPDPGEEQTVSTDSTYTSILVGAGAGESGTLTVAPGVTLNTGGVDDSVGGAIGQTETATGKVIVSGTDAKWIDSGNYSEILVGQDGTGSIEVSSGGSLDTQRVVLAQGATGNGTVTVSGQGSSWVNAGAIFIGDSGTGTVTVSDGATVQTAHTFIGQKEGSLTLEGAGTHWFSQFGGQIGRGTDSVSGTLLIKDGATFEAYEEGLYVSKGSVTVTGEGSQLLVGTENSDPPSNWLETDGSFTLGGSGEGSTVLITDGGVVNSDATYMSSGIGDYSSITVSGEGSKLINNLNLYIGGSGTAKYGGYAEVIITDGGYVSAVTATTGVDFNGSGFVRISGEGSTLDVQGDEYSSGTICMCVGYLGGGKVVVQNGGLLKVANVLDIASRDTSTGLVIIGAAEGDAAEAAGTVEAANGLFFGLGDATLLFNHNSEGYEFGTSMSGDGGLIRHLAGDTILTGDNTALTNTEMVVTGGKMTQDGEGLTAGSLFVGGLDGAEFVAQNGAQISTTSLIVGRSALIDEASDETGILTVTGAETEWNTSSNVHFGYSGDGTLNVTDGASFAGDSIFLGSGEGSKGTVNVSGEGTTLSSARGQTIGGYGEGTFNLSDKAKATEGGTTLGGYVGGTGTANISGEGTLWEITQNSLTVGSSGTGVVNVTDGAQVNVGYMLMAGSVASGAGTINISGEGSAITLTGTGCCGSDVYTSVGVYSGEDNSLNITEGGTLVSPEVILGHTADTYGALLVDGEGSLVDSSVYLAVGSQGTGEATLSNGGTIRLEGEEPDSVQIAYKEGSAGVLNIGATAEDAAAGAGYVESDRLFFGLGDARLVFNHTDTDYEFDTAMSGEGGEILHLAGVTNFTGDSSGYAGTLDVSGGSVYANGDLSGADVTIGSGALLGGSGSVGSIVVNSGGTLSTGNSPGVLTVSGEVLFETGSNFDIELASELYDGIYVETGDVTVEDGALLNILEGAEFLLENPYPIIELAEGSDGEIIVEGDGFIVSAEQYDLLETLVGYEDGLVTVTYQGKSASWSDFLATANQGATANALQALGKDSDLYKSAVFLTKDEMADVISSLSGEVHASVKSALIEESYLVRSLAMDHAGQGGTGLSIWANAFGNWGSQDGNDNAAGIDRDSAGVFMGAEVGLTNWNIGVLAGYGSMDIDLDGQASSADADSFHLGAFAGGSLGKLNLRAGVSQSWHDISTSRTALFPGSQALVADYDGTTTQVFGELGYSLKVPGASLEPFVGLAHVSLDTDAFTESGGEAALRGEEMTTTVNYSTVGLRGSTGVDAVAAGVSIRGMLGWQHAFDDDLPSARLMFAESTSAFGVTGAPISEDVLLAEAGLDVTLSPGMTLNLSYKGRYGNEGNDSAALGGLSIGF